MAARMMCHPQFIWLNYKNGALGCFLCHALGFNSPLGKYTGGSGLLKVGNLERHGASIQHRRAEAMLKDPTVPAVNRTPTKADFARVWKDVRNGTMKPARLKRRTRNMEFCLAEALREKHRRFLVEACTVSVSMDGRQSRLLLRFSATHSNTLQVRKGIMGLERDYGAGNQAHTNALRVMVGRFCSPGVCHPVSGAQAVSPVAPKRRAADVAVNPSAAVVVQDSGGRAALDDSGRGAHLLQTIKEATHLAVADAAGDGQIAIDNLRREGFWSNLMARHFDQAHGARRIAQRPWQADTDLQDVVNTLITGPHSLTMLFENSRALKGYLSSNLEKYCGGDGGICTDEGLSSGIKKHRFDSTQMPMVRAVLRTRANTATAVQIAQAFKGDRSAMCCEYYLLYVSGTTGKRRLLLLGMMTDAGDEALYI